MSEIIHKSSRGTVEVFEENGEKRIRRTVNAELPLYETLKNFECEYLPRIYSVDIAEGRTVVTEEFISGKNLLAANLDEKQVIHAMVQLCAALDFIHGLGIVHRDIKPSNILLATDGNIRLIDFEAARFVRDGKDKDTRYLGTDGFAPPEQYGFSQTDPRADIYAAGQTMKALLGSLSAKRKYAKIIRKCTALDPAERYQSARELSAALTNKREKISAFAVLAAATAVLIFALAVPKEAPVENIPDEAVIAAEAETTSETTSVSETEFTVGTTTVSETETSAETETASETESVSETTIPTETENTSETSIAAETEITTKLTTVAETKSTTARTTVTTTEMTTKTETSAKRKAAGVTTTAYDISIPDNLPISLSAKEYASSPERQPYYTKINIQSPAYVWVGDDASGFQVDNGSYLLKNTYIWIAMYRNDYIDNDILINGEIVNASSSGDSSNFGIRYTIGTNESEINITSKPTVSRKSTIRLEHNGIEVTYYVNDWTSGGNINNGDVVRFDTPIVISCYKNLIAGCDITVNGKVLPVQTDGDNIYMFGIYTANSKETVINIVKRNKLTEYERTNFVPVYFGSGINVLEFPFSGGYSMEEYHISYESGKMLAKGTSLRISVFAPEYNGKKLKINGSEFDMNINDDESFYLLDYIIPNDVEALNITLE